MAFQSKILFNSVYGLATLTQGVLVTLTNDNLGDETTYQWSLAKKPAGSATVLVDTANPDEKTMTPDKPGTYIVRLLVNGQKLSVAAGVVYHPGSLREPAVGENTEISTTEGWSPALQGLYQRVSSFSSIPLVEKSSTTTLLASEMSYTLLLLLSASAIDITFPSLTAAHDGLWCYIMRKGASLAQLLAPATYSLHYSGGTSSPYALLTNGDGVWVRYRHSDKTFYIID